MHRKKAILKVFIYLFLFYTMCKIQPAESLSFSPFFTKCVSEHTVAVGFLQLPTFTLLLFFGAKQYISG